MKDKDEPKSEPPSEEATRIEEPKEDASERVARFYQQIEGDVD